MRDSFSTAEKLVMATGVLLIAAGLLANEKVLAWLMSADGTLQPGTRVAVWVLDLVLIASGVMFILFARRHKVANLLLLLFTVSLCLVASEGVLRLIEPEPVKLRGLVMENPHGTGSYRLKPGVNVVTTVGARDIVIKTNSHGMWWKEVSREKRSGMKRIAFVGDSFVFGLWADSPEKAFVGVVASLLDPGKYEVLNFGVPGYGPPDVELQVREEVLDFDPDYIVFVLYNGNDFRDAFFGINKYTISDGVLLWNDSLESAVPAAFRRRESRLSFLKKLVLYRRFNSFVSGLVSGGVGGPPGFKASRLLTSQTFWSRKDYPDVALEAKDRVLESLEGIRTLAAGRGIPFAIVSIPYAEQVFAGSLTGRDYDLRLPQRFVREYAEERSVPYLDLLPVLRAYVSGGGKGPIYVPKDTHFNNRGHHVVGREIANFLKGRVVE